MKLALSSLLLCPWFVYAATSIDLDTADQYRCSFDDDVCDWTIDGPISHGTGGCDHGWPTNAFNGTNDPGQYICFYLETLPMFGTNQARFISPTINTTRHVVLSFAIGTVRPPNANYMNIIMADEHGGESLVCSTSDLLLPWQRVRVGLWQPGPYKVIIEGIPNPPFYPNFGIDDLTLTAADPGTTTVGASTAECSLQMTTPALTTAPKPEQGGNDGPTNIVLVPIVLGSAGGLLVLAVSGVCLWKKYGRKVSPEKHPHVRSQVLQ